MWYQPNFVAIMVCAFLVLVNGWILVRLASKQERAKRNVAKHNVAPILHRSAITPILRDIRDHVPILESHKHNRAI